MTAMFSSEGGHMDVVGGKTKGHLPHPPIQALKQGSVGEVLSDMQRMQKDEKAQHEQTYIYENGHNDHGMGQ